MHPTCPTKSPASNAIGKHVPKTTISVHLRSCRTRILSFPTHSLSLRPSIHHLYSRPTPNAQCRAQPSTLRHRRHRSPRRTFPRAAASRPLSPVPCPCPTLLLRLDRTRRTFLPARGRFKPSSMLRASTISTSVPIDSRPATPTFTTRLAR